MIVMVWLVSSDLLPVTGGNKSNYSCLRERKEKDSNQREKICPEGGWDVPFPCAYCVPAL